MAKVFIVHRWDGSPSTDWYTWLRDQLEEKDFEVFIPILPNPGEPKIDTWVGALEKIVGTPDENTFFVAHSIGTQTVLRYLQTLPEGIKVGGVVLVAGFVHLNLSGPDDDEESRLIAKPWLETPLDWEKIKSHCEKFVLILSDNDPYVSISDAKIFEEKLNSRIIIEKGQGHFNVSELPLVLEELLRLI